MNNHHPSLIIAGSIATATIAFASSMAPASPMPWGPATAMLLGTYALGLGIGALAWKRRG